MTEGGSTPGNGDPDDATKPTWPAAPPPPGMQPPGVPPPAAPPGAPPPTGAPAPWSAPYDAAGAGSGWAAPPVPVSAFAVPGAPGYVFAGGLIRFVAYLIDGIILWFLGTVVFAMVGSLIPSVQGMFFAHTLVALAIDAIYFIGLWTSEGRATVGMRILKVQVGNAFDGRKLDLGQGVRRWLALGSWLAALGYTEDLSILVGLVALVWIIILLITTVTSPTKQGLHDRFANSAVVAPASGTLSSAALACLAVAVVGVGIVLGLIVALIFLGSQITNILSEVGTSI